MLACRAIGSLPLARWSGNFPQTRDGCSRGCGWELAAGLPPTSSLQIVPVQALSQILETYGADRIIDFVNIDTEDSEEENLDSTSFSSIRPRVLIVETVRPFKHEPAWKGGSLRRSGTAINRSGLTGATVTTAGMKIIGAFDYSGSPQSIRLLKAGAYPYGLKSIWTHDNSILGMK